MSTIISGDTGVSQVQDGVVGTNKLAANAVTPAKTQVGALPSMVRLNTANGYGSTNTMIRRFTNVVTNQGSDITYADSATLGASFTINTAGVYAISYGDVATGAANFGISRNSTQLTTAVSNITAADRMMQVTTPATDQASAMSVTAYLSAGDVIRPHTEASAAASLPQRANFTITRVA